MVLVVGGHSRNLGKTSVVAEIIRRFRDRQWTAVKITQYGHGVCARSGSPCGCEAEPDHPVAITEEYEPGASDSGRFLAAGAQRSFWLRTPSGQMAAAAEPVRRIIARNRNVILESNSVLEVIEPDIFLMVLDFACRDFKPSSLKFLERADAFLVVDRGINAVLWEDVARGSLDGKPQFPIRPPRYVTTEVCAFIASRLGDSPSR